MRLARSLDPREQLAETVNVQTVSVWLGLRKKFIRADNRRLGLIGNNTNEA